jgi:hypothetical protein
MAEFPEETVNDIKDYIYRQGLNWAKDFIAARKSWLTKQKITASRDLINSIQSEVQNRLEEALMTRIQIEFETYGRYLDIKTLKPARGGGDYVEGLEDWIKKKGFERKFIDGFIKKRRLKRLPPNILNQIAWGIVINRTKKYKRRQWWQRPATAAVTDLYNRVAAGLPELVAKEITKQFGKKYGN